VRHSASVFILSSASKTLAADGHAGLPRPLHLEGAHALLGRVIVTAAAAGAVVDQDIRLQRAAQANVSAPSARSNAAHVEHIVESGPYFVISSVTWARR